MKNDKILKKAIVALSVVFSMNVGVALASDTSDTQKEDKPKVVVTKDIKGNVKLGKAIFSSICIGCHGPSALGGVGPKLQGQTSKDIAEDLHAYKDGKQRGPLTSMMAPMAGSLSDKDIKNVVAYIASIKKQ